MNIKDQQVTRALVRVFSFKELQLGRDVWQTAEKAGLSLKELQEYISFTIQKAVIDKEKMLEEAIETKKRMEELLPKCPKCGFMFFPRPIKTPKGPGNLYGYKTHWFCGSCLHEKYSKKGFENLYRKITGR